MKKINMTVSSSMDYIGNYIYKNGTQSRITLDCGEVTLPAGSASPTYYYDLRDYQGSVRVAVSGTGAMHYMAHYYPYGAVRFASRAKTYGRNFISKELDRMHGLDWMDFNARMYEPTLGRFTTPDPLAEKYYSVSPYAYCMGNPVKYSDRDGRVIVDGNGNIVTISRNDNCLSFSPNATQSIIRIANALNLTNTGQQQLSKLINSDIKVSINIVNSRFEKGNSITYGETVQGNFDPKDNYGTYYKNGRYGIKEASIKLYEGSISESIKVGSRLKHEGLSLEQAVGAVAGHEIEHATNKKEISKDKAFEAREKEYPNREVIPNKIEKQIIKESKLLQ